MFFSLNASLFIWGARGETERDEWREKEGCAPVYTFPFDSVCVRGAVCVSRWER